MKSLMLGLLCLGAGLLGGAWSARGEIGALRQKSERLRRDLEHARKSKTATDLAMMARISQTERPCPPAPPVQAPLAPVAPAAAAKGDPGRAGPAPPTVPSKQGPDFPFSPADRRRAFDEFTADLALSAEQQAAVQRVGEEFQRSLQEKLGGFITRFALAEATDETPRPREVVRASDELLHVYLGADDKMRALLDEDQLEALDDSDFDLVMLVDFEALKGIADRAGAAH